VFALASERKFGFVFFELKLEIGKPISVLILMQDFCIGEILNAFRFFLKNLGGVHGVHFILK
jgi:hypothetical protein